MRKKHLSAEIKIQLIEKARKLCESYGTSIAVLAAWNNDYMAGRPLDRKRIGRGKNKDGSAALGRYLRHMAAHPNHTAPQAAMALGVTRARIYQLRKMEAAENDR